MKGKATSSSLSLTNLILLHSSPFRMLLQRSCSLTVTFDHYSPLFASSHWPPPLFYSKHKLLVFTFMALYDLSSLHLSLTISQLMSYRIMMPISITPLLNFQTRAFMLFPILALWKGFSIKICKAASLSSLWLWFFTIMPPKKKIKEQEKKEKEKKNLKTVI